MLLADDLDGAFVGTATVNGHEIAVYNVEKVIEILQDQGLPYDEAREYVLYNTTDAYVGPETPLFFFPCDIEQVREG